MTCPDKMLPAGPGPLSDQSRRRLPATASQKALGGGLTTAAAFTAVRHGRFAYGSWRGL